MLLKKKIVLRYVLAILLVMQTVNLGALQGVAASGIPVTIQNSENTESLVIESATAVLDTNDEAIVTVTVKNNSTTDHVAGFVATGFDVNGKAIETNTYFLDNGWGTPKKIPATSTQELTLRLKTGSEIANVTVSPLGMHKGVSILSSAYRVEGGNIIASAVVENASEVEKMVGLLAEAKDSNGLNYMVKTVTPERFGPAPIKSLTAVLLEIVFEGAAADIDSMGFSLTGGSTGVELLSSGVQKVNGQLVVTGVAENGSSVNSTVGFTVTGYDENDLPIETATDLSKDSFGAIQVKPHVPVGLKAVLTAGDKIKRVETKVTGVSQGIELLSYGVNNVGDQYQITGVVENGTDVASELELIARSYNYSGELIEQKRVKTNGFFEKERIIPPHAPALLSLTLNDANVEKILVDTPDKIDSTQNVLYIVDQKAPYVKTSFSTQNANVQGKLSITFNENIFSDTGFEDILLVSESGEESQIASVINGNQLEVTLKEVLDLGKAYTLKIPANALKDYVGNSLGTNHEYPFQTKPEAGNVEDFLIVKGTETWSANQTFAKSVIVPPNTVLTIPDGAIFLKDLIVYGSLQIQGSFNVNGTWFNGMGYPVPPVSIISQVIDGDGDFTVKGKTVPGFTLNAGEHETIADAEGNFELTGTSADGVVLIEVEDNLNNSYPAKKIQYDPLIGDQILKVEEAVNAINAIPAIDVLTLKDETLISAAREKVNAALNAGADESQILNLNVLIEAETKLEELKSIKQNSITAAVNSIDALPTTETLSLVDEPKILAARGFVKKAIDAGATEIEITNLAKLTGLEEKLAVLKAAKQSAVEEAISAIDALPTEDSITLADANGIEGARALVNTAVAAGALETEITNLSKLVSLEAKLVELLAVKKTALGKAIDAIAYLPTVEAIILADEPKVKAARELVNQAISAGALESEITNMNKLNALEEKLAPLIEVKDLAITEAIKAIDALPAEEVLTLADELKVNNARTLVNKALEAGASKSEITNLMKLDNLENRFTFFVAVKQEALAEAEAAIEALPTVETVILADEPNVKAARELVNKALAAGSLESEVTKLSKLNALEEKLVYLKGKAAIIDEAIAVIDNLPNEETLKLSDAEKVEEARALVNKALDAGIVEMDITNLGKLVSLEAKITELLHVKAAAVENAITAIQALPSLEALKITDEGIVQAARELVNKALEAGALESEVTNLEQLIDLEEKLAPLIAEKLKAVKYAIDAIANLSEDDAWLLAHEPSLIGARGSVEYALKLGALESEITNLNRLVTLEERYATLYAAKQATKDEAIAAISQLPSLETLKLLDEKKVTDARALVKIAFEAGILDWEITNLNTLVALEERLIELKAIKATAVELAIKAISDLVDEEEVAWGNAFMVEEARKLVRLAIEAGASESEITNLDKLVSLEKRIMEMAEAITAADDFIAALPEMSEIKISDEAAIVKARELINYAISLGADTQSFKGLAKLDDLEWVLNDLKAARATLIQNAEKAIEALPSVDHITLEHQKDANSARDHVNHALAAEATESDISNYDKLIAIEERLAYLKENLDIIAPESPIVYEVTDYDLHVKGKAEPGSIISVKIGGSEIGSGIAQTDGTFSVEIPAYFTPGSTITVTATDAAGNVSNPTTVITVKVLNGWRYTLGTWYYIQSGKKATGWNYVGNKWYHFSQWGAMDTGWLKENDKWYYLTNNGDMVTGWIKSNKKWYYLEGSGVMKTGWVQSGGKWYYLAGSGAMKTGWVQSGGKWYYLTSNGAMKTGWIQTGGKWYYLYSSGVMAYNTTINGYKLGSNGAWIQ